MKYEDAWQLIWAYGEGKSKGPFISVTETLEPIWKEIENLRAQVEELEYQLRMAKEMQ